MEMRTLGELEVSVAGLGCNNFGMTVDEERSKAIIEAALDVGINHFDTADIYGGGKSEEFVGKALGSHSDDVVITTKVGMGAPEGQGGGSKASITGGCEESLAPRPRPHRHVSPCTRRIRRRPSASPSKHSPSWSRPARSGRSVAPTSPERNWKRPRRSPRNSACRRSSTLRTTTACSTAPPSRTSFRCASSSVSPSRRSSLSRAAC